MRKRTRRMSYTQNERVSYNVDLGNNEIVSFVLAKAFASLSKQDIHKVLTKGEVRLTNETSQGVVNYRIVVKERNAGFINFKDNDLDDDSPQEDKDAAILELSEQLANITIDNILEPLSEKDAAKLVADL